MDEISAHAKVFVVGADIHDGPDDLDPVRLRSICPGDAEAHDDTVKKLEGDFLHGSVISWYVEGTR